MTSVEVSQKDMDSDGFTLVGSKEAETALLEKALEGKECGICMEEFPVDDLIATDCCHIFCRTCMQKWQDTSEAAHAKALEEATEAVAHARSMPFTDSMRGRFEFLAAAMAADRLIQAAAEARPKCPTCREKLIWKDRVGEREREQRELEQKWKEEQEKEEREEIERDEELLRLEWNRVLVRFGRRDSAE